MAYQRVPLCRGWRAWGHFRKRVVHRFALGSSSARAECGLPAPSQALHSQCCGCGWVNALDLSQAAAPVRLCNGCCCGEVSAPPKTTLPPLLLTRTLTVSTILPPPLLLLRTHTHHKQVGKHLGDVSHALPLRCVCKEWREVATLGAVEATLDLEPRLNSNSSSSSNSSSAAASHKEQLFFKHCPQLRKLTYHVSPWVSLAQVRW